PSPPAEAKAPDEEHPDSVADRPSFFSTTEAVRTYLSSVPPAGDAPAAKPSPAGEAGPARPPPEPSAAKKGKGGKQKKSRSERKSKRRGKGAKGRPAEQKTAG